MLTNPEWGVLDLLQEMAEQALRSPSYLEIQEIMALRSEIQAREIIRSLETKRYISREQGSGQVQILKLPDDIIPRSPPDDRPLCVYHGGVAIHQNHDPP